MNHPTEIWKSVAEFEGIYSVSSLGRVRRDKGGKGARAGIILRPAINPKGYRMVTLHNNGFKRSRSVHTLVAGAFLGPRPVGLEVNHKDGDKLNNASSNLEYVSGKANVRHAWENNLVRKRVGEKTNSCKLTARKVKNIRALKGKFSARKVATKYGVVKSTIQNIWNGKTWTHV